MEFSRRQIELAAALKEAGLPWRPRQGQYIYDLKRSIEPGSPFQSGIYFMHDFECFVNYFGSVQALAESCVWVPTFEEARTLLGPRLSRPLFWKALQNATELDFLYVELLTDLKTRQ